MSLSHLQPGAWLYDRRTGAQRPLHAVERYGQVSINEDAVYKALEIARATPARLPLINALIAAAAALSAAILVQCDQHFNVDLDGILVLTPMTPIVAELAREIERLRLAAGLITEDLLTTLREQRDQHLAKQYQVAGDGNL